MSLAVIALSDSLMLILGVLSGLIFITWWILSFQQYDLESGRIERKHQEEMLRLRIEHEVWKKENT
ncbi:MAG: hypothetical protein NVSMB52_03520 [Chloroflexota bacterium]